jgi:N-acetylglucosamine-6-phosphate deacetylase
MNKLVLVNGTAYVEKNKHHIPIKTNVYINNGIIERISQNYSTTGYNIQDISDLILVPGAFDTHCHGGGPLINCTEGVWSNKKKCFINDEATLKYGINRICYEHALHGTTSLFLTSLAADLSKLNYFLKIGSGMHGTFFGGAILEGLDIEGTFLAYSEGGKYIGAQNKQYFIKPSIENYKKIVGDNKAIKKVCIGLEWGKSAHELATYLNNNKIVVGIGHSGANEKPILELINKIGKIVYVHLGNGPNSSNLKTGFAGVMESITPSIRLAQRKGYQIYAEQILDNIHVDSRFSVSVLDWFGKKGIIAITDNIGITEHQNIKDFTFSGIRAVRDRLNNKAIWIKGNIGHTLCGSTATTMDILLSNYLKMLTRPNEEGTFGIVGYNSVKPLFSKPITMNEAMDYSLDALCLNPSRLYGLDSKIGSIKPGKEANIVALKIDTKKSIDISVKEVWIRGNKIIGKENE